MSWNQNNQNNQSKQETKFFTIGAGWNQDGKNPSLSLDRAKLRQAIVALTNSGYDKSKVYITVFDNNRKEPGSNQPDYNLCVKIPVSHYPEQVNRQSGGWSGTAASAQREARQEQARQQEQAYKQRQNNTPYNPEEDSDIPF
jgi:uncharacterized protein with von Willebrand factor type A (vWA) domain